MSFYDAITLKHVRRTTTRTFRNHKESCNIHRLTCNPARADLETALALDFPESLPALPPAYDGKIKHIRSSIRSR